MHGLSLYVVSIDSGVPPAAGELKPCLLIGVAALAPLRLLKFT